jgi:hypothetical protein
VPALITFEQDGLAAPGEPGVSREDGLADGSVIYVISTAHERTAEVALLWVGQHPRPDTTSVQTLTLVEESPGEITYTFEPTANVFGSWRVELVTDRGTPREDRQVRIFAIKPNPWDFRIPAANEVSDPEANLRRRSAAYIARSEFNLGDGVANSAQEQGSFVSHWRPIADLIFEVNRTRGVRTVAETTGLLPIDGYLRLTNSDLITVFVPTDAQFYFPIGHSARFASFGTGETNLSGGGVIHTPPGRIARIVAGGSAWLVKVAANEWDLYGALASGA